MTLSCEVNKRNSFLNYIISFFIYSVILWVYTTAENWVMFPPGEYDINRLLCNPYAPYVALEVIGIMGLFTLIAKLGRKKDINPTLILLVVISVIGFGVLEYLGSWAYEMAFSEKCWDYSNRIWNINGRICVERIIALTIVEIICVYMAQPFINKSLNRLSLVPKYILAVLSLMAVIVYLAYAFMG